MIIDDEEMILESLSAILTKEGYEVDCAKSGIEALDILTQRKYDLVITDIRMPGLNGLEVVERVKGLNPAQKIMMITGYASLETAVKAQHRGVCDYLIKPIDVKGLKGSIRRAIGEGQDNRAAGHPDLEDKLRDLSGYFTLLSDFTASLNVSLDVGEILSATLDRLKKIAESDIASIYLFPKVVNELYYLKNIDDMPSLSAGEGISRAIAEAGEGIYEPLAVSTIDDPLSSGSNHPDLRRGLILRAMEQVGARQVFVVPIVVKKRVIGLADACRSFEQPFTETDQSLLKTLVNQAALALAKALSYLEMKERNKEIELIYSLSLRLNQSLKLSDSIKAICEGAVHITGASGSLLQTSFEPGSIKNFIFHRDIGFHKEMKRGSQDWLIPQAARKEAFFSRNTGLSVKERPVAVNEIVSASVQEMEGMAKVKGVSLEGKGVDESITTYADSALLKRVLHNLLSNAIKNTPSGGRVQVSAREVPAGSMSDDAALRSRGWVEISVEDTGVGIPREALTSVFERFYTAGECGDAGVLGTGLGLAITKDIVEAHGGRIWVESSQGGGTKFKFTIPRKTGQEGSEETTDA